MSPFTKSVLKFIAVFATGVSAAIGFMTLVGYGINAPHLYDWLHTGNSMAFNTALCFVLNGISFGAYIISDGDKP